MERRILVPFDASEQSTRAVEWTFDVFTDANVTVFHVIDPSDVA